MTTVQRVSTPIAISLETIMDLLAVHVEDLIDDKLEQVVDPESDYTWSNWDLGSGDIKASVVDDHLIIQVEFDLHEDSV